MILTPEQEAKLLKDHNQPNMESLKLHAIVQIQYWLDMSWNITKNEIEIMMAEAAKETGDDYKFHKALKAGPA